MTWNFQIIKHDENPEQIWFGLHEVYRNDEEQVTSWTEEASVVGDNFSEVLSELRMMLADAQSRPVLKMSDLPQGEDEDDDDDDDDYFGAISETW